MTVKALISCDRNLLWPEQLENASDFVPLKYVTRINIETLPESTSSESSIEYIDIGSISSNGEISQTSKFTFKDAPSRARRKVYQGDTIVSTVRPYLKAIAYINEDDSSLIASTGFAVISPIYDVLHPRYLYYWMRSSFVVDEICARSVGVSYPATNASEVGSIPVPTLSIEQQEAIASFLDRKTAAINTLITKKQHLIQLLEEKHISLIAQTVTKGLNHNAIMKDSGIPWINQIPIHWKVNRLGFVTIDIQTGPFGSQLHASEYVENAIPTVNPANMRDGRIIPDYQKTVDKETALRLSRYKLKVGDLVFARRGELGRCVLAQPEEQGWLCGTGSIRVRLKQDVAYPPYFNIFMRTQGIASWLSVESVGSTMENLNTDILSKIPVLLPPKLEQIKISQESEYLNLHTNKVIKSVRKQIDKLQEYRQSLITAAVTGKINVNQDHII